MKPEAELSFALRAPKKTLEGKGAAFSFVTDLKTQGRAPQNICLRQVQKKFSKEEEK